MRLPCIPLALALATAASPSFAQHVRIEHAPAPTTTSAAAAPESTMRVYIDPVTGRRSSTPTDEQLAELAADPSSLQSESNVVVVEERLADGTVKLTRPGGFMSVMTAQARAEGRASIVCNDATHEHVAGARHAGPTTTREER